MNLYWPVRTHIAGPPWRSSRLVSVALILDDNLKVRIPTMGTKEWRGDFGKSSFCNFEAIPKIIS